MKGGVGWKAPWRVDERERLLLVLVLLLVVCIAVGSLLHDGERATFGGTADHLLLDARGDGGGLLLLGLGRLHCCLLLGRNHAS